MSRVYDIRIDDHGSIVLLFPMSDAARSWIREWLPKDVMYFGKAVAIEPRYVPDIIHGMLNDGLTVGSAVACG